MWFTPSVGATSTELHLYSSLYKATQFLSAHSAADLLNNPKLCTQLQNLSSTILYALSCRGHPRSQLGLNLKPKNRPQLLCIKLSSYTKTYLTPLHKCLFIQVHYYNTMGLKTMGSQNTGVIYKRRGFDPTPKPLRLFCAATPLTSFAPKTVAKTKDL